MMIFLNRQGRESSTCLSFYLFFFFRYLRSYINIKAKYKPTLEAQFLRSVKIVSFLFEKVLGVQPLFGELLQIGGYFVLFLQDPCFLQCMKLGPHGMNLSLIFPDNFSSEYVN